jgi:hypothetical protein
MLLTMYSFPTHLLLKVLSFDYFNKGHEFALYILFKIPINMRLEDLYLLAINFLWLLYRMGLSL